MKYFGFVYKNKRKIWFLKTACICVAIGFLLVLCLTYLVPQKNVGFKKYYYAISVSNISTKNEAEEISDKLQMQSASGKIVVWKNFCVLCFLYESRANALNVQSKLLELDLEFEIFSLKTEQLTRHQKLSILKTPVLNKAYNLFFELFNEVYLSVCEFDKQKILEPDVFVLIQKLIKRIDKVIAELAKQDFSSHCFYSKLLILKNEFKDFLDENSIAVYFSSGLKTLCFDILLSLMKEFVC